MSYISNVILRCFIPFSCHYKSHNEDGIKHNKWPLSVSGFQNGSKPIEYLHWLGQITNFNAENNLTKPIHNIFITYLENYLNTMLCRLRPSILDIIKEIFTYVSYTINSLLTLIICNENPVTITDSINLRFYEFQSAVQI